MLVTVHLRGSRHAWIDPCAVRHVPRPLRKRQNFWFNGVTQPFYRFYGTAQRGEPSHAVGIFVTNIAILMVDTQHQIRLHHIIKVALLRWRTAVSSARVGAGVSEALKR